MHLFTAYYLQVKLANASELYGVLGVATTALFFSSSSAAALCGPPS